jgi:two-component system nitrogen regulation sensor histidine kinase NtrY
MTFRRKLLTMFALTVILSVAGVAWLAQEVTRNVFEKTENQRVAALVVDFQREFNRQGDETVRRVERAAQSDAVNRMAVALNGTQADSAEFFDLARSIADNQQLDFLELLDWRGTIISSAQWPAEFGYPEAAFNTLASADRQSAFLKLEELQDSTALGLFAVRTARAGDRSVYVVGGRRLDKNFLSALTLPQDMRALVYENRGNRFAPDQLLDPAVARGTTDPAHPADKFLPLVDAVRGSNQEMSAVIRWNSADEEVFHAIPLRGIGEDRPLLAILLIGNSRKSYVEVRRHIRDAALLSGGAGIVLAILLSSWAAARVTRPVEKLAAAAQDVAKGDWNARVEIEGQDEIAQLASSFNRMTAELLAQKEHLVQTERVAAWRELARRLAHELKNPLFPLQLTVENVIRAREQNPQEFDEVFKEGSQTLLGEIANLKGIINRFSEFSKMPQPQFQLVQPNEIVRAVSQLFQAQFNAPGKPGIECTLELKDDVPAIAADPDLLHRAISNLVLNAMDAMPNGGQLTLRSRSDSGKVVIEVSDTGSGLTQEECERIFTPYYTSKQHGTGLGLAIVQSVISDHGGRISVRSEPGKDTTFAIELPVNLDKLAKPAGASDSRETVESIPS